MPEQPTNLPQTEDSKIDRKIVVQVLNELRKFGLDHTLDLNVIDGEFYFRSCLSGFDARLERARAANSDEDRPIDDVVEELWMQFQLPIDIGHAAIRDGAKLRLRSSPVTLAIDSRAWNGEIVPVETRVSIEVFSVSMSGKDVAEAIIAGYRPSTWARPATFGADENVMEGDVRVTLVDGDLHSALVRRTLDAEWEWADVQAGAEGYEYYHPRKFIGPPHLRVDVDLPLPPAEYIVARYNAARSKWQDKLPTGAKQSPAIAMRTWTIALMMVAEPRLKLEDAIGQWQKLNPDDNPIDRYIFFEDRNRLLSRVPEARRYLMIRKRPPFK